MDPYRYLNVVETAGLATACVSLFPSLTRNTGAPRVVGLAHPVGHPDPPPPIAQLLTKKPWLVPRLATGRIPPHLEEARS